MDNDLHTNYLTKFRTLNETAIAIEALLKTIQKGAVILGNTDWQNTSPQHDVAMIEQFFFTTDWPTKEHIISLVGKWRQEHHDVVETYAKIPSNQRAGLQPPPAHG